MNGRGMKGREGKEEREGKGTEGRRVSRIQQPPGASQNLGPALLEAILTRCQAASRTAKLCLMTVSALGWHELRIMALTCVSL